MKGSTLVFKSASPVGFWKYRQISLVSNWTLVSTHKSLQRCKHTYFIWDSKVKTHYTSLQFMNFRALVTFWGKRMPSIPTVEELNWWHKAFPMPSTASGVLTCSIIFENLLLFGFFCGREGKLLTDLGAQLDSTLSSQDTAFIVRRKKNPWHHLYINRDYPKAVTQAGQIYEHKINYKFGIKKENQRRSGPHLN